MEDRRISYMRTEETARRIQPGKKSAGSRENPRQAGVTPEERDRLISQTAYHLAERRGFAPGAELDDWLKAEAEVDSMLRKRSERRSIV